MKEKDFNPTLSLHIYMHIGQDSNILGYTISQF